MAVFTVLNFILMVIRVKSMQTPPPAGDLKRWKSLVSATDFALELGTP
jgi:hypothetical protein